MIDRLFAAALLLASNAGAQTIAGVVRDTTCMALPGVEIVLNGDSTELRGITRSDGSFEFRDLSEPRYSVRARLNGFYAFSREGVLPSDEASRALEIRLPLGPLTSPDPPLTISAPGQRVAAAPPRQETDNRDVRVTDENCVPLRGATIELRDTSVTRVRTDEAGWASLPAALFGEIEIRVAAPGFVPVTIPSATAPFKFVPLRVPLRRGRSDIADILEGRPPVEKNRIVAMGDSTTAGTPAFQSPREAPPNGSGDKTSQYAYWLMRAHPGWEVINQGINGQRSDEIRARFEDDVIAKKPAVVVIIAGVNDVYQGRSAEQVKRELGAMYARAREAGIRVVAGTIIPYDTATPEQNARMHDINDWIEMMGRDVDPGVIFVDTRAAVAAPRDPDRLISSPDGLHPDAAGYRRMANAIEPAIEQALRARR